MLERWAVEPAGPPVPNPDSAIPAGRYELLLGGQYYDFIVAGNVTDPAQCVEGFATVRGPAFYECKTQ